MSNNPDYDACIAAGNSPAVCAATFGAPGGDAGTDTGNGDTGGTSLAVGVQLMDQQRQLWEVVQIGGGVTAPRLGLRSLSGVQSPVGGGDWSLYGVIQNFGGYFLTASGRAIELDPAGGFTELTLEESGTLFPSGGGGGRSGGGGGGGGARAYSGTQAAQEDQQAHDAEMMQLQAELAEAQAKRDYKRAAALQLKIEAKRQEFQAKQDRLNRRNQVKLALMGELSNMAQTAAGIRQQYRSDLMGLEQGMKVLLGETLGKDVVRGAIMSTGQVQRGETPMGAYRSDVRELGQEAGSLAGELGPMPMPDLGAGIAGLREQMPQYQEWAVPPDLPQLPTSPAFLAEGGALYGPQIEGDVLAVDGVPVGEKGTSKVAVIVGEGRWDGDEEVVVQDRATGETEIIPLAGGAAQGASLPYVDPYGSPHGTETSPPPAFGDLVPPQDPYRGGVPRPDYGKRPTKPAPKINLPYDPSTLEQALAPIYDYLGLTEMPKVRYGAKGYANIRSGGMGGADILGRLGIQPRLVRNMATGQRFFINASGERQLIPGGGKFKAWGFSPSSVVNMSQADMREMYPETAGTLRREPALIEEGVSGRRFPPAAGLLVAPSTLREGGPGFAVPAMRTIAGLWPDLSPAVQDVITSAFGVANITPAMMEAEREFFTPGGTAYAPGAARLG